MLFSGDFEKWALESLDFAQQIIYPGVFPGQALSADYLTKASE